MEFRWVARSPCGPMISGPVFGRRCATRRARREAATRQIKPSRQPPGRRAPPLRHVAKPNPPAPFLRGKGEPEGLAPLPSQGRV